MRVEDTPELEPIERLYERIFRAAKPRSSPPEVIVRFRRYANATSRIRLSGGILTVHISDLLQSAPATVQEALASILVAKLLRRVPERSHVTRYRRYLNRSDVRSHLQEVKRARGRKFFQAPEGRVYNLCQVFEDLNREYFHGLMARPKLGWSLRPSRTTLGHYDPSHHMIVLSRLLDSPHASASIVRYVMFHEMLHLRFPTEHRGAHRCVHTADFKAAERQFNGYREAKEALNRFVEGSAGRV